MKRIIFKAFNFILILLAITAISCSGDNSSDSTSNEYDGPQKYLELQLDLPSKLITVSEYSVTGLRIRVTDPSGRILQIISWDPTDGPQRYSVPVRQLGEHAVYVTHLGEREVTDSDTSEVIVHNVAADESATFNIQAMIITEVNITPGAIASINIDAALQNATAIARDDVLQTILLETNAVTYAMTRMSTSVQPGTLITEASPVADNSLRINVQDESYLFLVDLEPGAYFEHAVKYVLVSANGETETYDARWWPVVDEKAQESLVNLTATSTNVVERNVPISARELQVAEWMLDPGILVPLFKEGFIIVQGLMPGEPCHTDATNTYNNGYSFFDSYKSSFSTIVGLAEGNAQNVLTEMDNLANDGCNPITIYIIAHGGYDTISLSGSTFTASQFAATMSGQPTRQFNFLLGSCHSGSFVGNLEVVPNVAVVKTSTSSALSAYPDWDTHGGLTDYNPLDIGSEWTSSLLYAAEGIVNTYWDDVLDIASDEGVYRTSVMLNEAGWLAVGVDRGLGAVVLNYDLSMRDGYSDPMHYCSWE